MLFADPRGGYVRDLGFTLHKMAPGRSVRLMYVVVINTGLQPAAFRIGGSVARAGSGDAVARSAVAIVRDPHGVVMYGGSLDALRFRERATAGGERRSYTIDVSIPDGAHVPRGGQPLAFVLRGFTVGG